MTSWIVVAGLMTAACALVFVSLSCRVMLTCMDQTRPGDQVAVRRHHHLCCPMNVVVAAHHHGTTTCVAMVGPRMVGLFHTSTVRHVETSSIIRGAYSLQELVDAANAGNAGDAEFLVDSRVLPGRVYDSAVARQHAGALALDLQHAARVVQREWRRASADPSRRVCRRRLLREFVELHQEAPGSRSQVVQ